MSVALEDVGDLVAIVEIVKDTEDVKWGMLRKAVHLGSSLPHSAEGSAGAVGLLHPRMPTLSTQNA